VVILQHTLKPGRIVPATPVGGIPSENAGITAFFREQPFKRACGTAWHAG